MAMILPIMAATIEEELRRDSALTVRYYFERAVVGPGAPSDAFDKYASAPSLVAALFARPFA